MTNTKYDVGIVGGGPAGLSAAIMLGRCCRRIILFDHSEPRNQAALVVNGFLGLEGVSPAELRRRGREQALKYDVTLVDAQVLRAETCLAGGFVLNATNGSFVEVRKILFATGVKDQLPQIQGITDFYGKCVHHCPYCDGWEHRNQRLVALGDGDSVVELALSLLTWSADVTACTNGRSFASEHQQKLARARVAYRCETIKRMEGEGGQLTTMILSEGPALVCDAVFFSGEQAQGSNLPQKLGCDCNSNGLMRHAGKQRSNVKGVFVAGDICSDVQFAIVAASHGAIAATAINEELHAEDLEANQMANR
jgi:thioredoxin reductase